MDKLDRNYEDFQSLEITDKAIIEDFLNIHIPIWEEDILKFENFKHLLTKENIKGIDFYSYISLAEDLCYTFIFNDGTRRSFSLDEELLNLWLNNHNLIK